MKRSIILAAIALCLAACATTPGAPPTTAQETADKVQLAYVPVRALASLCAAGLKPCEDPNISMNVAKALPLADAAVAAAVKNILANPDQTSVAKWVGYAMSAIDVLTKALATYSVK